MTDSFRGAVLVAAQQALSPKVVVAVVVVVVVAVLLAAATWMFMEDMARWRHEAEEMARIRLESRHAIRDIRAIRTDAVRRMRSVASRNAVDADSWDER